MEYFAGSLLTLITMYIVAKLVNSPKNNPRRVNLRFSQSRQNELVKDYIPLKRKPPLVSQSSKHLSSQYSRVVFVNDIAYWLEDGRMQQAPFDGTAVDYENKITVDMMAMDSVELDKMVFIVERLTEGLTDDSGNSGN
jgi:hypothetical protein